MKLSTLTLALSLLLLAGCGGKSKKMDTPPPIPPVNEPKPPSENASTTVPISGGVLDIPAAAESQAPSPKAPSNLSWSYQGETGPTFWSVVDPLYAMCGHGKKQSPIDLVWRKPVKGGAMDFKYKPEGLKIVDNGYTLQVNFTEGQKALIHGKEFDLDYLQVRTSSEHTISGNELPMELQLFHSNKKGKIIAVSIIVIEGQANPALEKIWAHIPSRKNDAQTLPDVLVNPAELIPPAVTHYKYSGSLTTPPCTEDVDWYVLNTPITASGDQILAFRKLYSLNKRPAQPLNNRKVLNY